MFVLICLIRQKSLHKRPKSDSWAVSAWTVLCVISEGHAGFGNEDYAFSLSVFVILKIQSPFIFTALLLFVLI